MRYELRGTSYKVRVTSRAEQNQRLFDESTMILSVDIVDCL
jgi:hypothetical protein